MTESDNGSTRIARRQALKFALLPVAATALALANARPAEAQTASDIDSLNLMVTVEYLLAQFLTPPAALGAIAANLLDGNSIAGTPVRPGRAVTGITAPVLAMITEMANDNRNHLTPMRIVVGVPVARQPLIDLTAATGPFSAIMQRAGVVGATATFDPYASETNFLLTLFYLKNVSVAAYRGLLPTLSNRVVMQNFAGLLADESIHLATVRSLLYERSPTDRANADRIAAFQNSLNGGGAFLGISSRSRTTPVTAANIQVSSIVPAQPTGEIAGRSGPQILNQLFVNSAAVTAGGFFPEGVNGNIRTSASA